MGPYEMDSLKTFRSCSFDVPDEWIMILAAADQRTSSDSYSSWEFLWNSETGDLCTGRNLPSIGASSIRRTSRRPQDMAPADSGSDPDPFKLGLRGQARSRPNQSAVRASTISTVQRLLTVCGRNPSQTRSDENPRGDDSSMQATLLCFGLAPTGENARQRLRLDNTSHACLA